MILRRGLMVSCAFGALILGAGVATAQIATVANSTAAPAIGNETADQAARAKTTRQEVNASSATAVGEVVVTALPRAGSVQNIPVAVSAYTDERRNLVGITTASDIVNFTPSVSLNGENLAIRGVNRVLTTSFGPPPGVAVFVDGLYVDSPDYLNQPDFLSDRIEILRGPQGTLSGRNAIGGAVNVISKHPTPDFHEEFRIGTTDYGYTYVDGSFSGPITNTLSFRLADTLSHQSKSDGFYKNLGSSIRPGSGDTNLADVQLEWKPTPNFDAWVRIQDFASANAASPGITPSQYPGATSLPGSAFPYVEGTRCPNLACLGPNVQTEAAPTSNPQIKNPFILDYNQPGYAKITNDYTITTNVVWNLPGFDVKYVGGYSQYRYRALDDIDGTPLLTHEWDNAIDLDNEFKRSYQNELDLRSTGGGKLQWSLGAFQYYQKYNQIYMTEEPNNADLLFPTAGGLPAAPNPDHLTYRQIVSNTTNSEAIYGNADYDLTDQIRLTAGARYTWDRIKATNALREIFDTSGVFEAPGIGSLDVTPKPSSGATTVNYSDWSGKVGAEWRPNSSTLIYGTIAKGYKSGGAILTDIIPIPTVAPETLYDYEVGVKKKFGSTLLVDAGAYYYDYHNLQEILNVQNNGGIVLRQLVSAQRARTYGFELESVWSPISNFQLTFNYSYLNARFTQFSNTLAPGQPFVDFSSASPSPCSTYSAAGTPTSPACHGTSYANLNGGIIPQSPENKVTLNPVYTFHLPVGSLTASMIYAFIDKQYYGIFNTPGFLAPSYSNLDLRLVYQPTGAHYTFIVYARNVTDTRQVINYSTGPYTSGPNNLIPAGGVFPSQGAVTYYINPPRVIGGEFQVRF